VSPDDLAALAGVVAAQAEAERESLVELCARLVAAPSVSPPGNTRRVARVVSDFLGGRGIASEQVALLPSMPSVVAVLDSGRPGRHLVLNVHLDTMPPGDEAAWTHPVWALSRREGRLGGLGMGNMKGAVAAMLHAASLLDRHRGSWSGRVTLTAVSDEVTFGEHGAAHLLAARPDLELVADGLLCGEGPGHRRLALGEKGVLWLELTAEGEAGHSSSVRRGRSATARIAAAALAVDGLTGLRGSLDGELAGLEVVDVESGLELTANVGTVTGGTSIGQVATSARAEVDLRLPPGISADRAEELVTRAVAGAVPDGGVRVRRLKGWDANVTSPTTAVAGAWAAAWRALGPEPLEHAIRLPASDASRWRRLGTPALCYGPQPTLSAGVDDYAEEDEVVRCAALYALTALRFLGS
jgi:succinyl-diaminopimelate desuccinylase